MVVDVFLQSAKVAQKITQSDVREASIFNAAVSLHNYFVMVSRNVRSYAPWMPVYQQIYDLVNPLQQYVNSDLFISMCEMYARSLMATYLIMNDGEEFKAQKKPGGGKSKTPPKPDVITVDLNSLEGCRWI